MTSQPPKEGQVVDPRADFMGQRAVLKTKLSDLSGGVAEQIELQLTAKVLTTLYKLRDLPHLPIATNHVDRSYQILLTSHSPGETSELPLVCQYWEWTPKE
jgi:hypothetical protein